MLVLHPSSRCDVCLEPYTQDSSTRSPHVVPCGHVFCRTCLLAIIPPNCPLCRKPYMPDRMKKLIVDKLEDVDEQQQGDSRRESELLRRLVVCWDDTDERLVNLTREVDSWLEGRAELHPALRKARTALADYQKLKTRRERDKLTIKILKEREKMTSFERDQTQAVELSMSDRIRELETKLAETEVDRQILLTQIAKHKLKNPLPQPPEIPVPLNQLTATPHIPSSTSLYGAPEAGSSSSRRQSHNNGSTLQPNHHFLTPYYANPTFQSQSHLPESEQDRKGKRRAREGSGRHSSASVYANGRSLLSNSHPNGVFSEDELTVILPGAVTRARVIPPKEVTLSNTPFPLTPGGVDDVPGPGIGSSPGDSNTDASAPLNPYSVAALYIGEYVNGYGEGYNTATAELDPNALSTRQFAPEWSSGTQDETPRLSWLNMSGEPVPSAEEASNDTHSEHESSARASTAEHGNDSSEERLVYHVNGSRQRHSRASSNVSIVDSDSSYAEGHVTDSSIPSGSRGVPSGPSYIRTPHRSHKRRTAIPPGHETDVENARRHRDDPILPPTHRPNSVSVSSWSVNPPMTTTAATIATASHTSGPRSRDAQNAGSGLAELGLSSFGPASMYPSPPGDTPRSTLSSLSLHQFPLREDDEIVMERLPSSSTSSGHASSGSGQQRTPRQRHERRVSFDHRPAIIGVGGSVATMQSVGLATTATSNVSAIVTTANANTSINEPPSSSRSTHRRIGRYTASHDYTHGRGGGTSTLVRSSSAAHTTRPPTILDTPTAVEDARHLAAAEMPRPLPRTPPNLSNALGLQLNTGERDNTSSSGGISAPTPMVSAGAFLRSWSLSES
ncbi:hypothetical protein AX15_007130 [Amanita polypyramis BW_CC]|nr:hypothetical protein AX15_007130 [Amanita polypyramis BW_CC]